MCDSTKVAIVAIIAFMVVFVIMAITHCDREREILKETPLDHRKIVEMEFHKNDAPNE